MVECDLAKVEVASSNLVSRSKFKWKGEERKEQAILTFALRLSTLSPSRGGVAKW